LIYSRKKDIKTINADNSISMLKAKLAELTAEIKALDKSIAAKSASLAGAFGVRQYAMATLHA
jgi:hypothetical protein